MKPLFIYQIDNVDIIGEFSLHYGDIFGGQRISTLRACYSGQILTSRPYELLSGYIDFNGDFYQCPINSCFLQLFNIKKIFTETGPSLVLYVIVYCNKFNNNKMVEIRINSIQSDHLLSVNSYINALNKYVERGNDIDLLKPIIQKNEIETTDKEVILKLINSISVTCYENSSSRVGKDNRFWNEAAITTLPESLYLKQVFILCLESSFESVNLYGNTIYIEYGSHNAYSPHHGKKEVQDLHTIELLKNLIKLNFYLKYDVVEERNKNLQIGN